MNDSASTHVSVMTGPVLEWLRVREDGTYVDCTVGAGGHSEAIVQRLTGGRLIAIDRDAAAVALASERLEPYSRATVVRGNYGELGSLLAELGISSVEGVLIDAGVSSMQLDTPSRGFSFQREGPLDMRMDASRGETAEELIASIRESDLARLLKEYGDVRPSKRIAAAICRRRDAGAMHTTRDLAESVREALEFAGPSPEELRTVFQAVRMAVNEELGNLESGLQQGAKVLSEEGRIVVITFHSGEDRIAKNTLRDASRRRRILAPDGRVERVEKPRLKTLTRKPVLPSKEEVLRNPRSASAKLRAAERLPDEAGMVS